MWPGFQTTAPVAEVLNLGCTSESPGSRKEKERKENTEARVPSPGRLTDWPAGRAGEQEVLVLSG